MNVETLRHVPLFESLDNEAATSYASLLESLDCKTGAVLFRAGDEGDAMYLIEEGKVRICVRAKDGHEVTLTELGRGDFFGEMALLDGKPALGGCAGRGARPAGRAFARAFSFFYAEQPKCRAGDAHCTCEPVATHR